MERIVIVSVCCLSLGACSIYNVSKSDTNKGIPILVMQPVEYQTTKIAQTYWKVQFTLKVGDETYSAPASPIEVVASPEVYEVLLGIGDDLSSNELLTPQGFKAKVSGKLRDNASLFSGCGAITFTGIACVNPSGPYARVLENRVIVVSELSKVPRYINTKRPWIGSASATIKLAADGTMTEAQSQVEDKTAETVLSMIPVAGFLTKQWNISAPSTKVRTAEFMSSYSLVGLAPTPKRVIELKADPVVWTYVLRKGIPENGVLGLPLEYSSCTKSPCVELVSATQEGNKPEGKDDNQEGWSISGSLIPPKGK
jgi:hypothetical protein